MRLLILLCASALGLTASFGKQSDEGDPYSLNTVQFELRMRSGGKRVTHSWTQKQLARIGDGVSIALIKILDERDLDNPQIVSDFLPIIRDSFAQPQLISEEVNKKPKVTLVLLRYLRQNVSNAQTQKDIEETIRFVTEKASI